MNAQIAAALFLVFVVSTPEVCSYGGVSSPWILGLLVLLAGYLQRWLESTDALKGALRGLLLTAIGLATAQWFAPLGWLGVGTGLSLITLSRYVRQRSILQSFLLASFGLTVVISLGLFSMKPAWLFMSSTEMHFGSFGLLVAFAALIGVFCDAKISALKHGLYALGVSSLSALMNSAFYEHGEALQRIWSLF